MMMDAGGLLLAVMEGYCPVSESGAQCVYAIDRDEAALQFAYEHAAHLAPGQSLVPLHGPFSDAVHLLKDHGVQ